MRITRSGLRRIIAEESARILAETKKRDPRHFSRGSGEPHRDGDGDDVQDAIDILNDTGEDPFPFGKPADADKTDDDWAEEQLQGVMDYYGHPDPYGDDEALEKGYEYDGAGGWKKPGLKEGEKGKKHSMSPREKLGHFLAKHDVDAQHIYKVIDAVVKHAKRSGEDASSESVTFNLPDEIIEALPEDEADAWHSMLDAVLNDEIDRSEYLEEGEDDDLGGAASASDSGDREGRRSEHFGDDPDWGPPGHDDWHLDNYDEEDDDIEGSDFDEMIDPADDNDDPMKSSWMNPDPYADTAPDDWAMADEPDWGRSSETGRTREKYRTTGDSDPGDAYTHMGPRGIDEARWAKLAGILKG